MHTKYCPGWRRHMTSLSIEVRVKLAEKYDMENINNFLLRS